jgi:ABC-type polar amino acid transport system ATPase subunit
VIEVDWPMHIVVAVAVAVIVGAGVIVIDNVCGALEPHALLAVTEIVPDVEPAVTEMLVVP